MGRRRPFSRPTPRLRCRFAAWRLTPCNAAAESQRKSTLGKDLPVPYNRFNLDYVDGYEFQHVAGLQEWLHLVHDSGWIGDSQQNGSVLKSTGTVADLDGDFEALKVLKNRSAHQFKIGDLTRRERAENPMVGRQLKADGNERYYLRWLGGLWVHNFRGRGQSQSRGNTWFRKLRSGRA